MAIRSGYQHLPAMVIIIVFILVSCSSNGQETPSDNGTGETPPGQGVQLVEPEGFTWDTIRRPPRWRTSSPIQWLSTGNLSGVLAQARESEKPVLCYISRYDLDVTGTIEDALFTADSWGRKIQNNFIAWEIDWWQHPGLAESVLQGIPEPALLVMIPDPDNTSDDFRIADSWSESKLLSFPLQSGILPLENPEADEKIAGYQGLAWDDLPENAMEPREAVDPDELARQTFTMLADLLDGGSGLFPYETLWTLYGNPLSDDVIDQVSSRVEAWLGYVDEMDTEKPWLPDEAFIPGDGWGVYPEYSLVAMINAAVVSPEKMSDLSEMVGAIGSLIYLESGQPGGGIPPYFDLRGTFNAVADYVNDDYDVTGGINFDTMIAGPRDIPWVNAHLLAILMNLAAISPNIMSMELTSGVTVQQFIELDSNAIISAILESEREAEALPDTAVYAGFLDMLNIHYQLTADPSRLESAGLIAGEFPHEEFDNWFDPTQLKFYPNLAIGLYHYGWLAESEDARESSRMLTEKCTEYAGYMDEATLRHLAFAYDVVHSKCPHVGIVGSVEDERSWELLAISLRDWYPGKVAQILDPERDAELIEAKWYAVMDEPTAFVCVDDSCYPPSSDPEELEEVITEVLDDLAEESEE